MKRPARSAVLFLALAALLLAGCAAARLAPPEPGSAESAEPTTCAHVFEAGRCLLCGCVCPHAWNGGVCSLCGCVCPHAWNAGVCSLCGTVCAHGDHDPDSGLCRECGVRTQHRYLNGVCACGARPRFVEDLMLYPEEVLASRDDPGQIDSYVYHSRTGEILEGEKLTGSNQRILLVYTPFGYDPGKAYDVVFLTNATNTNSAAWLTKGYSFDAHHVQFSGKMLIDGMIAQGYCEPTIFVSIEYRRSGTPENTAEVYEQELRRDVLPFLISRYATYASLDESGALIPAREHFAQTGASFGSTMSWELMTRCSDLFSYWGLYSGRLPDTVPIAARLDETAAQYPEDFVVVGGGRGEPGSAGFARYIAKLIDDCDSLEEGRNIVFFNLEHAIHWHPTWFVLLHNSMQVFFRSRYDPSA